MNRFCEEKLEIEVGDLVRVRFEFVDLYETWVRSCVGMVVKLHGNEVQCNWEGQTIQYAVGSDQVTIVQKHFEHNVVTFAKP